jgi:DNA-binding NtrC family response regulator
MLYSLRREWRIAFVTSGREALDLLSQSEVDVLVTDLRMPEMSGLELLAKVASLHPQTVRIVLSGTADLEIAVRSATLAPCPSTRRRVFQVIAKSFDNFPQTFPLLLHGPNRVL